MDDIGIITANFGRVPILRIFCAGIRRLREETGMNIPVVCVGDISGKRVCEEYNIEHIVFPNKPLTGKFNRACIELKGRCRYISIFGSDNLIATSSFLKIYEECERGTDLIGLSEVYFMCLDDSHAGKLIHFRHTTVLGVGRTVRAGILDDVSWMPWTTQKNRGIDVVMLDSIRDSVKTSVLLNGEFVFDLKTSLNLNPVHHWAKKLGYMPTAELFWSKIGLEEKELVQEFLSK